MHEYIHATVKTNFKLSPDFGKKLHFYSVLFFCNMKGLLK